MSLQLVDAKTILNRTGGFLHSFTHTLNPYRGCSYGKSLCGVACYAPEVLFDSRAWGTFLMGKRNAAELYPRDLARARRRGAVKIFMSSVTDPYVPQEKSARITRAVLEAMADDPPDKLILQTHTPHPLRDIDLLKRIPCSVQITVETDQDRLPGFPPHAYPPRERLDALCALKAEGFDAVGVVAPLLPLADREQFARDLDEACTRIIVDHYLVGDGSRDGARTKRRGLPQKLPVYWNRIEALHDTAEIFAGVLGKERVGVSRDGFNR